MFAVGFYVGSQTIDPEIKEVQVVKYETKWKIKKDLSFQEAIGHINSPIVINHKIEDNWIRVTAQDSAKFARKDIELQCATEDWTMRFTIGAVCLSAGMLVMLLQ